MYSLRAAAESCGAKPGWPIPTPPFRLGHAGANTSAPTDAGLCGTVWYCRVLWGTSRLVLWYSLAGADPRDQGLEPRRAAAAVCVRSAHVHGVRDQDAQDCAAQVCLLHAALLHLHAVAPSCCLLHGAWGAVPAGTASCSATSCCSHAYRRERRRSPRHFMPCQAMPC